MGLFRRTGTPYKENLEFKKPAWKAMDLEGEVSNARKQGEHDGRVGHPGPDDDRCPHYDVLKNRAETIMSMISEDWRDMNRVLRGEWSRLRRVAAELDKQVAPLEKQKTQLAKIVSDRQKVYDKRRAQVDALDPSERHRIGRATYIAGLVAVFLIDVPLNVVVFNIFHEQPLATLLLAALLGMLMVPAAHVFGIELRSRFKHALAAAIAAAVPTLLIFGIAYIRLTYLEKHGHHELSGFLGFCVFAVFNLAVFTSAIFLSYLRHDQHEQSLEEAARELKKAKGEFEALESRLQARRMDLAKIRGRIAELRTIAEEEHAKHRSRAHSERNGYERLMAEYASANKTARTNPGEVIPALERQDKATVPPDLETDATLDWGEDENDLAAIPAAG